MLSPVNPFLRQSSQTRVRPSDALPNLSAAKLCTAEPTSSLIHLCDALLYSKEEMLMLYLFIRFSKKRTIVFLVSLSSSASLSMCSAARQGPRGPDLSLSSAVGAFRMVVQIFFLNRKKGFKSNLCAIVFHPYNGFLLLFSRAFFFHALLGVHHFIAQHSLLRRAGDT